jgi:hypothetical protein
MRPGVNTGCGVCLPKPLTREEAKLAESRDLVGICLPKPLTRSALARNCFRQRVRGQHWAGTGNVIQDIRISYKPYTHAYDGS